MSRVMVIAGGTWQCPIVKTAKQMGHYVICSNLYEDSPAFEYADVGLVADVLDREKNLSLAREYKPDAVLTDQTDIAVPTVAYLAEQLGLRGIGSDVADRFTNKFRMREYASKAGVTLPRYRLCHSAEEAAGFLLEVPLCIIKPIDSQSSRGIHIVSTREDIERNFEDCVQYSNAEKAILIEEYIDGTEFTVDGVKTTNGYEVLAISEKEHYAHNPSVASRLFFTQSNPRFDYDRLRRENAEMIGAMGLPFGLTHTEYKYKDGRFYLIETAARGGGTKISSDITKLVSGINSNELYLNMLTGGSEEIVRGQAHECAVLGFFDFEPGKVTKVTGVEEALRQEGVQDIHLDVKVGDKLEKAHDDRSRCGHYIIYADSVDELNAREKLVKETVRVVTE